MQWQTVRRLMRTGVRIGCPVLTLVACAALLARQVSPEVAASVPQQLAAIGPVQWCLAALFTAGSFWAVAQYDVQAHRALGTGIPGRDARVSGAVGIAVGQTVGFGLLTGALARWRMLPGLSMGKALKLSTFVSLTFVVAWACTTGIAALIFPTPAWTTALSDAALVALPVIGFVLFWQPAIRLGRHSVPLPSIPIALSILVWTALDMILAAAALWVLLPAGAVPFTTVLPLFMIALGCGLISNTPGGVGPFELVLVSALSTGADAAALAGIMGFRLVYYAVPACLAVLLMLRPLSARSTPVAAPQDWSALPRSEAQALRQNGGWVAPDIGAAIWPTAQTATLFADPAHSKARNALHTLRGQAKAMGRLPLLYKSSARCASVARRSGWAVMHVADDAIVDVPGYTAAAPSRSRLRRKLRAAERAGIHVDRAHPLDHDIAAQIDSAWQRSTGPARGGSMGRYDPDYVSDQWVISASCRGETVAFATFHIGQTDWCLDLMRHRADAPDGVMYALVHHTLLAAQTAGVAQVNLASILACPDPASTWWRWAAQRAVGMAGGSGLRQFKSAFAPRWVPRYAAAPSWAGLALGLADIARTIHAPPPLGKNNPSMAHHKDENYELASRKAA